jgi:hypothetical protein
MAVLIGKKKPVIRIVRKFRQPSNLGVLWECLRRYKNARSPSRRSRCIKNERRVCDGSVWLLAACKPAFSDDARPPSCPFGNGLNCALRIKVAINTKAAHDMHGFLVLRGSIHHWDELNVGLGCSLLEE